MLKTEVIRAMCTEYERWIVETRAEARGLTLSEHLRSLIRVDGREKGLTLVAYKATETEDDKG